MLLIFLVGVVSLILIRTLKKDISRYAQQDSDENEEARYFFISFFYFDPMLNELIPFVFTINIQSFH
jgi:hypothetical protein